jgi:predicted F0F1-ATPase subunit
MEIKTRKILNLKEEKIVSEEVAEENKEEIENEKRKFSKMMSLASELGFSISLPLAGGAILGQFLDKKFGTNPKLTLSLIITGLMLGIVNMFFIIRDSDNN